MFLFQMNTFLFMVSGIVGVLMVPFFSMMDGNDTNCVSDECKECYYIDASIKKIKPNTTLEECWEIGNEAGGIFWYGGYKYAWERLGINLAGLLAIIAWSILWSVLMFGILKYAKLLRIDRDTEFKGNDLVKHGESAYPVDAWVELQYEKRSKKNSLSVAPHMQGAGSRGRENKGYNDAFEMVPTTGKLFQELSKNYAGFQGENVPSNSTIVDNKKSEES